MKLAYAGLVSGIIAVAGLVCTATAQTADEHKIVPAPEVKWAPGPSSIPPGAQAAVLYGDPGKEGLFALRVKVPNGYHIPPHTHPKPEIVTVISGTIRLGMGTSADQSKAQPLPAGSFFAMPPGMAHYVFADGDTVIQINSTGPWGLTYLNPEGRSAAKVSILGPPTRSNARPFISGCRRCQAWHRLGRACAT